MRKIGHNTLNRKNQVITYRKKVLQLLKNLNFSNFQSINLSSIVSEICHLHIVNFKSIDISIYIDKHNDNPELIFEYLCYINPSNRINLSNFYKQICIEELDDKYIVKALCNIPKFDNELTEKELGRIIKRFNDPTKEELFSMLKEKNSELKKQSEELSKAKDEADTANYAKSEFLANMSHEIRTPMNAILGFTDILKSIENDSKKRHYINSISSSGRALLNLINDILDLSKIESGKLEIQKAPFSLYDLCSEIKTLFAQKIRDKGVDFILEIDKNIPSILIMDELRLRQVFINLISNAVKFTHKGHIKFSILSDVTGNNSSDYVNLCIKISDSGIGIPKDQQSNIFGAFEQVKGQNEKLYGGSGLGLAITSRIVKLMGGTISLESEEEKGTTFTIEVPNIEISKDKLTSQKEEDFDSTAIQFKPASILVVDDVDYNREIITTFLNEYDFTIIEAINGKQEVELAMEKMPDLILTDIKMPVMSGDEATKILKANDATKHIPIVAVTASALKKEEEEIRIICDGYLTKPINKSQLIMEMMKHLEYYNVESKEDTTDTISVEEQEIIPPPQEELKHLFHLAMRGILSDINDFADKITASDKKYKPFADKLKVMVNNLDDEEILALTEQYLEN